jgi:hypothetical protein
MGFWVQGFGYMVLGTGFWVQGLGYRVLGTGSWVQGFGYRVLGTGFGYRVLVSGFGLWVYRPETHRHPHPLLRLSRASPPPQPRFRDNE